MPDQQIVQTYLFVVKIPDIDTIGYFSRCSGLELWFDVYEYREGGNNDFVHRLPGGLNYPNLILSRGLTDNAALLNWVQATHTQAQMKEITLTLQGPNVERVWTFADAFPVKWTGPSISADDLGVATESLEIAHSGLKMP
jgi:phage tail-like protein